MATDITPMIWVDGNGDLTETNLNTEIRDAYTLLLNPPAASIRRSTSMSIPSGALTPVIFDTLNYDTEDPATPMWNASFPTRLTVTTPGWYECIGSAEQSAPATTAHIMSSGFRVNGVTLYNCCSVATNGTTFGPLDVCSNSLIAFNASDYAEFWISQNKGAAITINQVFFQPFFCMTRRRGL
jgi:hypothetical protein